MIEKLGLNYGLLGSDLIVKNKKVTAIEPIQQFYSKSGAFDGIETVLSFIGINNPYFGTINFSTVDQMTATEHKSLHIYASDNIQNFHILPPNGSATGSCIQLLDCLFYRMTAHIDQLATDLTTCYFNGFILTLIDI